MLRSKAPSGRACEDQLDTFAPQCESRPVAGLSAEGEMSTAFIFPGQGSQAVRMGKALADSFSPARAVFEEVDAALSQPLSKIIFEGPEAELTLTANAQPALMAVSLAAIRVLEAEAGLDLAQAAKFVAGHSLGEYSALCAAGALTLSDAARLLLLRGSAMQAAVPVGEGAMAALLGAELDASQQRLAGGMLRAVHEDEIGRPPDLDETAIQRPHPRGVSGRKAERDLRRRL